MTRGTGPTISPASMPSMIACKSIGSQLPAGSLLRPFVSASQAARSSSVHARVTLPIGLRILAASTAWRSDPYPLISALRPCRRDRLAQRPRGLQPSRSCSPDDARKRRELAQGLDGLLLVTVTPQAPHARDVFD